MSRTILSRLIIEAVDKISTPAKRIAKTIRSLEDMIEANNLALDRSRGRMVDAVAGFYTLRAALSAPINSGLALEAALNGINQKANLTTEQMNKLLTATRAASRQSNQATSDLLLGVDYLVGMGLSAEDAAASIKDIGIATTATGGNITDMAQASYAAMANLKVPADQVAKALDAMAVAGKRGGFELKDMAAYLPASAAAYQSLGQSGIGAVADLAAAMQVLRMDTGDASTAATNLQNVLLKMAAPATEKKFAKMGVNLREELAKAAEQGLSPLAAIAEITNKTLKGDLSKLGYLFEDTQVQAGMRSLIQHKREYLAISEEAAKAEGVNAADFAKAMATGAQQIKKFNNAMADLAAVIGTVLIPAIERFTAIFVPLVDRFISFTQMHPKMVAGIISITSAVVGLRIAMTALSYVRLLGKGGLLAAALPMARVARHFTEAATNAIALQNALGGLRSVVSTMDKVRAQLGLIDLAIPTAEKLTGLQRITTAIRGMVYAIPGVTMFTQAITGLVAAMATISAPVWLTVAAVAAAIAAAGALIWKYWDRISSIMSGVGRALGEILAPALEKIRPILDWFAPLGDVIAAGWQKAKDVLSAVGEWFGNFFTQEKLTDDQKAAYEQAGYDLVMAFWDGMKRVMSDLVSWVTTQVDTYILAPFTNALNTLSSWSGMTGGAPAGAPNRADVVKGKRAKGGPISRGSTYWTGENGPELITASRSGYVHPNKGGAGSGAPIVNMSLTVNPAPGMDEAGLARRVAREVEGMFRGAMRGLNADTGLEGV